MLVAAAVCPHPPALVTEIASGSAAELDAVRHACYAAVDAIQVAAPQVTYLVGAGETKATYPPGTVGTFAKLGVAIQVALPGAESGRESGGEPRSESGGEPRSESGGEAGGGPRGTAAAAERAAAGDIGQLPLSLAVGAWLLDHAGWSDPVHGVVAPTGLATEDCARLGAELATAADRVALIVMADGSAHRGDEAPRPYDPRAQGFDAQLVEALRSGDPHALLRVDPHLADELTASGRAPLQVLAGAAEDAVLDAMVEFEGAPYGVGYVVAVWERHG